MSKYKILETDEAINDVSNLAIWIFEKYCNEAVAENLIDQYSNKIATLRFDNVYHFGGRTF